MKKILAPLCSLAGLALLSGCASFESAYYVDREFGQATQASFDQMILYPDYRYADKVPEGAPGIISEEVMAVHIETYREKPAEVEVFQFEVSKD